MPVPIRESAAGIDLSARFFVSTTVVASPSAAVETTVCTLTVTGDLSVLAGVYLFGYLACTIGTSGTAAQARIRRTNTAGTIIQDSGAATQAAATLCERSPSGFDANLTPNQQVYVLTLTVPAGAATSTVSAAALIAVVV